MVSARAARPARAEAVGAREQALKGEAGAQARADEAERARRSAAAAADDAAEGASGGGDGGDDGGAVLEEFEAIQLPGDLVFVPEHYGHATLNLADVVSTAVEFD